MALSAKDLNPGDEHSEVVADNLSRAAEKVYKRHANIDTAKPSSQHFARRSRAARALRHADEPPPLW